MLDYRKLAKPMHLAEWSVRLVMHPAYPTVRPFQAWRRSNVVLSWYQAYNAVKHDREQELPQATLRHVVSALAGALVLVLAQFGPDSLGFHEPGISAKTWTSQDPDFRAFEVVQWPIWRPKEVYVAPYPKGGDTWTEVPLVPRFLAP